MSTTHPDIEGGLRRITPIAISALVILAIVQASLWWGFGWDFGLLTAFGTLVCAFPIAMCIAYLVGRNFVPFFVAPELNTLLYVLVADVLSFALIYAVAGRLAQ